MGTFAWPKVGRAGLGNGLLPWARAELFVARTGAKMVEPDWTSFRLGPYLRGEADKRRYGGYFYEPDHVRGGAKLLARLTARQLDEGAYNDETALDSRALLVRFSGIEGLFSPLLGHWEFIRERLWRMTRVPLRPDEGPEIVAMHVRRGDITRQGFSPGKLKEVTQFTPLSWYVDMARALRAVPPTRNLPIVVFTDGYPAEVAELLSLPGVQLRARAPAITDLWAMSRASLLFGSGFSTFSMWASYLGGMPTLYAPGKLAQRVLEGRTDAIEAEVPASGAIPAAALEEVNRRRERRGG